MTMGKRATKRKPAPGRRGRALQQVVHAIVALRRGRWTMHDFAGELGVTLRTAYRIMDAIKASGVRVDATREPNERGMATPYYRIPPDPLRKLMATVKP